MSATSAALRFAILLFAASAPLRSNAASPSSAASPDASQARGGAEASEDTADLLGLLDEPIVSTGSRAAESRSTTPATTVSVSAEDLRRYGIHSLDEAIDFLSLGMVTQNPLHSVDIGARGVLLTADFGNHVLLLLNGHALNEPWNGTAYFERGAAIPFELIDHIEFILGPGPVLYVSGAMLGVINVVTKRAKDFDGAHAVLEGEGLHLATGDLATAGRVALGYGETFELLGRSAELTCQVEYFKQTGPAFSFGPQRYGDDSVTGRPKRFNADGANAGVWGGVADRSYYTHVPVGYGRLMVGDTELQLRAASYKRATPYLNNFNQLFGDFNDGRSYEIDQWIDLELKHRTLLSSVVGIDWRLYGDLYRYEQPIRTSAAEDCTEGLSSCIRRVQGRSDWAGAEVQMSLDWRGAAKLATLLGAEGQVRRVRASYDVLDVESSQIQLSFGRFDVVELTGGLYLQQTASPWPWLDLNARLRLDVDQRFGAHLSPRGGATFSLWHGGALKYIFSEAFRPPSDYELYYVEPDSQIQAEHLRPEIVRSHEIVLEQRLGAQRFLLDAFYTRWTDLMAQEVLAPDDPALAKAIADGFVAAAATDISQVRNSSGIVSYGVDAAAEGSLLSGALRYGMNLTLAHARRDGTPDPLPVAPHLYGNARASYALGGPWPTLGLAASYAARRPADRAFDGGFSSVPYAPAQLTLRATAQGPLPWVAGLSYQVSAHWAASAVGPYVVGPNQAATADQPTAELVPVDQFRAMLGFRLDR